MLSIHRDFFFPTIQFQEDLKLYLTKLPRDHLQCVEIDIDTKD